MKVNRIDVLIKRAENKHKQFLDIDLMKIMSDFKFGGKYTNDSIELSNAPEAVTSVLDKLKIVFERLK
jgi:hypothetical protein